MGGCAVLPPPAQSGCGEVIVKALLKSVYRGAVTFDSEARAVISFARSACAGATERRVLDVGCGYGRNLRLLRDAGFVVLGVEVNERIVRANRDAGLNCMTTDEFARTSDTFDLLLMSHVIEHFAPASLVSFMDGYLDRLKPGGALIIATPLLGPFFYDDFDHVKPYHPIGLLMVFGEGEAQVQYYARNRLALEDVWIRRSPLRLGHGRGRYVGRWRARARQVGDFGGALLFRATGGLVGTADGWVGLFRKRSARAAA
jgi:SAM-dependent methyltransferase